MSENSSLLKKKIVRYPHTVKTETLNGTAIELTNFFFRYGANIYVLTYEKNGEKKHTFIDTGYAGQRHLIFPILEANNIILKNIENIIITHRHPDHSGLAGILAEISGATILAHASFKDFVDGTISEAEKRWLGNFDPSLMKNCRIEYLFKDKDNGFICIGGTEFPRSGFTVEMGHDARLELLTVPENDVSHSPDQIFILYSPRKVPYISEYNPENNGFRPSDEIIFSGDLWLMQGPIFERSLRSLPLTLKFIYFKFIDFLSGKTEKFPLPSEQDAEAKDSLKHGFTLIRVKPGHGDEFLGSNLIPKSLLADRDLLIKLGYKMDDDRSILQSESLVPKIKALKETAYADFLHTLNLWMDMGYTPDEISGLLARIYREQTGGGRMVEEDRKERKQRLKNTLRRLTSEKTVSDALYHIAASTLSELGVGR